jgi:uncharacterized oxidoreductase
MKMQSNTIFITGGGSGIGRALAESFHKLGNRIIIAGRREEMLKKTCEANPGMNYILMDVTNAASIQAGAAEVTSRFPRLNCVINNAGIQREHDFTHGEAVSDEVVEQEIDTNLLGLIRVSAALQPHLQKMGDATLINVSSGLGFVPLARFPVYCATKAAVHSFCLSIRRQLRDSGVKVIEIVPPYVATDLGHTLRRGPMGTPPPGSTPTPMPLEEYIVALMEELADGAEEAAVGAAKRLLSASSGEAVRNIFAGMNP